MMDLNEAIAYAEEVVSRERELYKMCPEDCDGLSDCRELKNGKDKGCNKCAEEHEQLAEWLKELKELKEAYESDYQVDDLIQVCVKLWG